MHSSSNKFIFLLNTDGVGVRRRSSLLKVSSSILVGYGAGFFSVSSISLTSDNKRTVYM
jgi:predicted Zn-dependent protease